ncbi:hypothetical protein HDU78_000342, partial [Chytriomyces hyalinus]
PRRLRSNPANFEPKSVVAIYNSKDLIIPVPSGPKGRRWDSILHFLQAVCGNFEPSNYTLKQNVNGELVPIPVDLNLGELVPGRYFVIPNDGDDLMVDGVGFPIVPKSKLKRNTNSGGPSSPSMLRSPRVEALADDDKESLASSNSESNKQSGQFRESIIARDGHCVVTRDYGIVEAAHILAHSWWGDYANRRDSLPQDIRQIVSEMNGGINSVENGILLNGTLAKAFDEGKFGFVLREGHYYFVAITTDFLHLEGVQVDENLRKRSDGSCWWSEETRPHPRLVEFHFRNSVFKQMRGAASETEDSDSDSDVAADQIATGKPATSEMAPSEIIDWKNPELAKLIQADSPLLVKQIYSIVESMKSAKDKLMEIQQRISSNSVPTSKGVSLLEIKLHGLLSYLTNLSFFILLKLHGQSTSELHPSVERLIEMRVILEKIKPMEVKLKYQIDKVLKAANDASNPSAEKDAQRNVSEFDLQNSGVSDPLQFKPNPLNLVGASTALDKNADQSREDGGVYRPPRIAPVKYSEEPKRRKGDLSASTRESLSKSRLFKDMRDTFDCQGLSKSSPTAL